MADLKPGPSAGLPSPRSARLDLLCIVLLVLVGVAVPFAVQWAAGAATIPRNDDWSYRNIAMHLAQTGRLELDGASAAMIVGQIVAVQPLLWLTGLDSAAFVIAGVVFAAGGVTAAYVFARRFLAPASALLTVGLVIVAPGYLAYATSFMSDVPAMALQLACLTCGIKALATRPADPRWLVASVIVGLVGFSVREFALAAPVTVLLAAILGEPRRRSLWALGLALLAVAGALFVWRTTLPGQLGEVVGEFGSATNIPLSIASLCVMASPAVLIGAPAWRGLWRRRDVVIGLFVGIAFAVTSVWKWLDGGTVPQVRLDNLGSQRGVPADGYVIGGRAPLFDDALWGGLTLLWLALTVLVLAALGGIVGAYLRALLRDRRTVLASPVMVAVLFVVLTTVAFSAYALIRPMFDRYLWTLVPPLAVVLMYVPPFVARERPAAETKGAGLVARGQLAALIVMLAVPAAAWMLNSYAFDAARWTGGSRLEQLGIPADRIDAGYEWVGAHAATRARPGDPIPAEIWYRGWWWELEVCGLVSSQPQQDAELVGTLDYRLLLFGGSTERLFLYRLGDPGCDG